MNEVHALHQPTANLKTANVPRMCADLVILPIPWRSPVYRDFSRPRLTARATAACLFGAPNFAMAL